MKSTHIHITVCAALLMSSSVIAEQSEMKESTKVDTYPLSTCLVSGEELGAMGDPFVFHYEGTEIRFCCESCQSDFLKDPEVYLKKLAAAKLADQSSAGEKEGQAASEAQHRGHDQDATH